MTRQEQIKYLSDCLKLADLGLEPVFKAARQHLKLLQDLESGKVRIVPVEPTEWMFDNIMNIIERMGWENFGRDDLSELFTSMVQTAPEYRFED